MILSAALIGLSLGMLLLIITGFYQGVKRGNYTPAQRRKKWLVWLVPFGLWMIYLCWLSVTGMLKVLTLPPRFPVFVFIPFFIFLGVFYARERNSAFIQSIPLKWTIGYQTFRILVEIILWQIFLIGVLPVEATFEGYNYDVIMGISAPLVVYFLIPKAKQYKKLLIAWNILGILMVLFVGFIVATTFYQPVLWGYEDITSFLTFTEMPYLLVAGFLAPSAVFMHVVTLIQLRKV